jgi:hypothetical protein
MFGPRRTASRTAVQEVLPGSRAAITEYGQPGINLCLAFAAAVDVAEQPVRAGRRARPQPVAHIGGQDQPPVRGPR